MANLIYSAILSLDGYIEDAHGGFDWAMPDEEVHRFANDLERGAGAFLYGRRMYETMMVWETEPALAAGSPITRDFAEMWQAAERWSTRPRWRLPLRAGRASSAISTRTISGA